MNDLIHIKECGQVWGRQAVYIDIMYKVVQKSETRKETPC